MRVIRWRGIAVVQERLLGKPKQPSVGEVTPLRNPSEVTPLRNPWVPQGRDFASNPRVAHSCESQEDVGHKTAEQFSTALRWGCRRWSQPCRGSGPRTCGPGSICWPGPSRCGQPAQVTAAAGQNRHHVSAQCEETTWDSLLLRDLPRTRTHSRPRIRYSHRTVRA